MNKIKYLFIAISILLFKNNAQAQFSVSFGDNANSVLNAVKYFTNQTNSSNSEISAYYKVKYENGKPIEILFVKKNLSNLYGTLTDYFSAKESFIFIDNKLSKKLIEIPEKSLSEVKTAIEKSNQFNFIDKYIFSEDYKSVYTVFLNSNKIATIQSLPTSHQSFPSKIHAQLDSIFYAQIVAESIKSKENEEYEKKQKLETEDESKNPKYTVAVTKQAEYKGGETVLTKYISQNINVPNDATDWHGRVNIKFTIDTTGSVTDIEVVNDRSNETYLPTSLNGEIQRLFKAMPKWESAETSNGDKVMSVKQMPLQF